MTYEQQQLLFLLLQERGVSTYSLPITVQSREKQHFPLSFAQRRLWLLNQLEPENPAYNMFGVLQLRGALDGHVLEQCFNEIIKRHDVLRAVFRVKENHPVMMIEPTCNFRLKCIDFSHLSIVPSDPVVQQIILEEQAIPFDLQQGPLLRGSLIKLTNTDCLLLFTMHHIISDAWSLNILIRELDHFYRKISIGHAIDLPVLSVQYSDYTVWQQEIVAKSAEFIKDINYWQHQLQQGEYVLNLPMDGARKPLQTSRGGKSTFLLSEVLSNRIKALSLDKDVSVFMLLLTVFQILLYRYSNQDDLFIGSVISDRSRCELEALIGLFSDTLVLRARLSSDCTFQDLLIKTKQTVLDAFAHKNVPFDMVVEKLNIARNLSYHPIFQVMFVYENKSDEFNISDIHAKKLNVENGFSKFDLTLFMEDKANQLTGCIEYNSDLFQSDTINSYIESYICLLEGVVMAPQWQISRYSIVRDQQMQKLLTWKDDSGPAKNKCLHEHFERWVEVTPKTVALSYQGNEVSYQELNQRSNQIANRLMKLDVEKGQIIATMLEVGVDQIATLLAINKIGGVFVCLDQAYPTMRLKQILNEVMPACIILDDSGLCAHHQSFVSFQQEIDREICIMNLSDDRSIEVQGNEASLFTSLNLDILPTDPVYIAYTSGSTGKPKGIVQTHGCSSQYMEWQSRQFQIGPQTRVAQWAAITYDASYSEIFGALCFGATLYIAESSIRKDPYAMMEWIVSEKINVIQLVPSFCKLLLQCFITKNAKQERDILLHLECVLLAGERLPIELAREFQAYFNGKPKLYNLYGPSEIVLATQYLVNKLPLVSDNIPIGAPFAGRQILILDKNHSLCPLRIPGDIYIKSPYLSQGYFQQPEETAKVFIQNPMHNDYPDRVYKTGDLGRWLNESEIEFLGRSDNQVKIRGSRVEPGEIESVLLLHDAVNESAVIVKYHLDNTPYLVAFVSGPEKIEAQSLKEFITDYLPSYMIPAQIFFLENFPRTISGKIDRKMLGTSFYLTHEDTCENVEIPENEVEKKIAKVWKELLHLRSIRSDANFFDLGGHSLLMVQVQLKLNELFRKNLALVDLFKYPTIKSLANFLLRHQTKDSPLQKSNQRASLRKQLRTHKRY